MQLHYNFAARSMNRGRMRRQLICFTILLAVGTSAQAQDSSDNRPLFASASLFYDFPQAYGIMGSVSSPYRTIVRSRKSKDGFTRRKDRFLAGEGGLYRYPLNYTGLLLLPGFGTRHYRNNSFFYETIINIGVLRTFYDGKVYEVDATGNVKEKKAFGRFYATTHLSTAFDFRINKVTFFEVKPSAWFQYPFDSFIKPHLSLQAGLTYELRRKILK